MIGFSLAVAALARLWLRRRGLYLGFDFSTQSLTTVVLNLAREQVYFSQLGFDGDLPKFQTQNGIVRGEADHEVYVPFTMLAQALEMSLARMPREIICRVISISGSAQQHGSVYWNVNGDGFDLDPRFPLPHSLLPMLARVNGPNWMDNSTYQLCRWLELLVPANELKRISGSRAFERFTGVQIARQLAVGQVRDSVKRVTLLSNALASVLCGKLVGVDCGDASGMNLMDLASHEWSPKLCSAHADLVNFSPLAFKRLLGPSPVPMDTVAGQLDEYFVQRFGFPSACQVVSFTGDNPSTVFGLGLGLGDCAISLGSSTTVLTLVSKFSATDLESHIMAIDRSTLMEMFCFKNGALVRDEFKQKSWAEFDELIWRGMNTDCIAFAFPEVEITPKLRRAGKLCFDANDQLVPLNKLTRADALMAVLHGQFLAIASRVLGKADRLVVTGGGSNSQAMVQVLANCFQLPVTVLSQSNNNAACLGAALRALGCGRSHRDWDSTIATTTQPILSKRYVDLLSRFRELEHGVKMALG
ncbi:hypothetical protein BASA81_008391 [Batrachochytrium salamandrivorans]|nr:hypothetical protein BASA81_008391 [Batrachochytrium salamandrivorans]